MGLRFGEDRGSCLGAAWRTLVVSVLLCWLPLLGPFVAGVVGGRKARAPGAAVAAALIPAALWALLFWWLSRTPLKVGGQELTLGAAALLGPSTAAAILGGALVGSASVAAKLVAAVGLILTAVWFVPRAQEVSQVVQILLDSVRPQPPAPSQAGSACPDNLRKLYSALSIYADSWGALPPARSWATAIRDNLGEKDQAAVHCPAVSSGSDSRYGYAMNAALGGKRLDSVRDRASTPLLYDSSNLAANANDNVSTLPRPGRHGGQNNTLYADGTVKSEPPR